MIAQVNCAYLDFTLQLQYRHGGIMPEHMQLQPELGITTPDNKEHRDEVWGSLWCQRRRWQEPRAATLEDIGQTPPPGNLRSAGDEPLRRSMQHAG